MLLSQTRRFWLAALAAALLGTSAHAVGRSDIEMLLRRRDAATARNLTLLVRDRGQNFLAKITAGRPDSDKAVHAWAFAHPETAADLYSLLIQRGRAGAEAFARPESTYKGIEGHAQMVADDKKASAEQANGNAGKPFDGSSKKDGSLPVNTGPVAKPNGQPSAQKKPDNLLERLRKWMDDERDGVPGSSGKRESGKVTFKDVIGLKEAKAQIIQFVDILKNPEKYARLGAEVPRGILMVGPPGNGKTLLGKALANEAGFSCFIAKAGPEFSSKWVGESAAEIRRTFEQARAQEPCIIFIDELDGLAAARTGIDQSVAREYNSTVEQLLVEMDGLTEHSKNGKVPKVFVIGATNRPDLLDPAVMRPGRLDLHVVITSPDIKDREEMIKYYVKKKKVPANADVDFKILAGRTTGMSGAAIKDFVNKAALVAAEENAQDVTLKHFLKALDRLQIGGERRMVLSDAEKIITARHELGHALVATYTKGGDPVGKITIIPRDIGALGVTTSEPPEDRKNWSKTQLLNQIAMAMGGRVAEKIFYNDETTGAASDLENSQNLAWQMVVRFGMSEKLGPVSFVKTAQGNYLSGGASMQPVSEEIQKLIDSEVKRFLLEAEQRAMAILTAKKDVLDKVVPYLIKQETMEGSDLRKLLKELDTNPGEYPVQDPPPQQPGSDKPFATTPTNLGCSAGRLY